MDDQYACQTVEELVNIAKALERCASALELIHGDMPAPTAAQRAEKLRVERWHATYNAAITRIGLSSNEPCLSDEIPPAESFSYSADWAHDIARMQADIAHGPLKK